MRLTGGELGGRRIRTPGRGVRPTQDRVREALFSSIGARLPGCRFLDLFAGSGAVGLEAWSRGAGFVCWVESGRRVLPVLRENVAGLCGPSGAGADGDTREWRIVTGDALKFLGDGMIEEPFDVVFADPPYDRSGGSDWLRKALQALQRGSILAADGIVVVEQDAKGPPAEIDGWGPIREKRYGGTVLRYVERLA